MYINISGLDVCCVVSSRCGCCALGLHGLFRMHCVLKFCLKDMRFDGCRAMGARKLAKATHKNQDSFAKNHV